MSIESPAAPPVAIAAAPAPSGEPGARASWWDRVDTLPPAPELPAPGRTGTGAGASHHRAELAPAVWAALEARARWASGDPGVAVLAAFAEVIAAWGRRPAFTLRVIATTAADVLLPVDHDHTRSRAARARELGTRLRADTVPAAEVAAELARRQGPAAGRFPVVYRTGADLVIGGEEPDGRVPGSGEAGRASGIGAAEAGPPAIECRVDVVDGGLRIGWHEAAAALPPGLGADMFAAFVAHLRDLAARDEAWHRTAPVPLPADQSRCRQAVNATTGPRPVARLHDAVVAQCARTPDAPAVIAADAELTYADLLGRAVAVAGSLREDGAGPASIVAVAVDPGAAQVVAVLGTLLAGAAYLPIDPGQPPLRRDRILADAGVRLVLVGSAGPVTDWPAGVTAVAVAEQPMLDQRAPGTPADPGPDDLAYVITTSGSTGTPKGVMISHGAALNTVEDINRRFAVGPRDRVLGLTSLGFDLSVYDLFGPLAVGGCLVVPDPDRRSDAAHWAQLVASHGVTLWNSVPAQLQLLADHLDEAAAADPEGRDGGRRGALGPLRVAMLSGDWIPLALPERIRRRIPGLRVVSLGGATEAAIWSIWHPVGDLRPDWPSIPYGTPLTNQTCHVLDTGLHPRPDLVVGDLYIGGAGLATGYLGDPERTARQFVHDPVSGARLYRTGDLARYHPDGVIELLGREDRQVKIRGYRVELAEIEAALDSHPGVREAVVIAREGGADDRYLTAHWVPGTDAPTTAELRAYLRDRLPAYMIPSHVVATPSLRRSANDKVDRRDQPMPEDLAVVLDDEAPRSDLERAIAAIWAEALGIEHIGLDDDFFELGGHSMLAAQMAAMTRAQLGAAVTVRLVFDEPTVRGHARALAQQVPDGADGPPANVGDRER